MNFLYIANIRLPTEKAHGVQIIKMCEAFADRNLQVTLLVPWRFNHIKDNPFDYYSVKKNFKIVKLFSIDLVRFGSMGFLVQALSFAISTFFYVLFKRKTIDYIFSRDEMPLWVVSFIKKNLVWEIHLPRANFIALSLLKRIKKAVTISYGLKDFYISKEVSPEKILVAHDGVDLEDFSIEVDKDNVRRNLNLPLNKPIVMYIGRVDAWKGVRTLLEASKIIGENIQMVIIGEGHELEELKSKYPHVIFLGFLPYRDLPYNQQAADILVVPNSGESRVSSFYTSPLKVFAHMASGIPVIASDLPSLKEVLNERNAWFAKPDDPASFAEAILEILKKDNYSRVVNMTKTAKNDVKGYSWNTRALQILKFLE